MRIFAIQDKCKKNDIGYLFYYKKTKEFYIELLSNLSEWDIPLLLSSLYKKGIKSIDSYWSKEWVKQRIVPTDRQNIGQILRDNRLKQYDEYDLLMLTNGNCEQDDYCLALIEKHKLPEEIKSRLNKRISNVLTLEDNRLMVIFKDNAIKICNLRDYFKENNKYDVLIEDKEMFNDIKILTDGFGVGWGDNLVLSSEYLYSQGEDIPINAKDLERYLYLNTMTTNDVMSYLNCSRQYVNELVKKGKLMPIKSINSITIFSKAEVIKQKWKE